MVKIISGESLIEEGDINLVHCAHCMALIAIPGEEYRACTHFSCRFCGKITTITQIRLGARWNWTVADEQVLEN